jgi:hypothetical protein
VRFFTSKIKPTNGHKNCILCHVLGIFNYGLGNSKTLFSTFKFPHDVAVHIMDCGYYNCEINDLSFRPFTYIEVSLCCFLVLVLCVVNSAFGLSLYFIYIFKLFSTTSYVNCECLFKGRIKTFYFAQL